MGAIYFLPPFRTGEGQDGGLRVSIIRARSLRKNAPDAERRLWQVLRMRQLNGARFRRQRPIGPYILDFVCLEKKIAIELDGGQHSQSRAYDKARDTWLRNQGFVVLRFWNHEIFTELETVKQVIWRILAETPSFLLPRVRGRRSRSTNRSHIA